MDTLDEYVRKNGMSEIVEELNRIDNGEVEHHDFIKDKKISADDWFEFLWEMRPVVGRSSSTSQFNYLRVGFESVEYVEKNAPVKFDDLVEHVASEVESASEDNVESWVGDMMATKMKIDDNTDKILHLDYLFEYTPKEYSN